MKPEAEWGIGEYRYAIGLSPVAGVPICDIRTQRPGTISCIGDDQIARLPGDTSVPRAF